MDSAHLVDSPLRIVCGTERGDREEGAGALQPAPRVAAVVGVLGDSRHGERVQRLEEQRPQAADEHRGVGVHPPDRAVLGEPARAGRVVDASPVVGALGPCDQAEERAAHCVAYPAQVTQQAHTFDGTAHGVPVLG